MTVAVVGCGSLIATALRAHPGTGAWRFVERERALEDGGWLRGVDVVVNCAFDPRLKSGPYSPTLDIDLRLATLVAAHGDAHYVMLGSRLAYGPAGADPRLVEDREPRPDRPYGIAKLASERAVGALLGARLTVLRLANVFGMELLPGRRSFFGIAMRSLRDDRCITLDMSPFVERDFVPVETVADAIVRVAAKPYAGIFNIGAGFGTPTGRIAQWLIEGHGGGTLKVVDAREHDAFVLDTSAARRAFGIAPLRPDAVRERCIALGGAIAHVPLEPRWPA